jgi:hypothetical protein
MPDIATVEAPKWDVSAYDKISSAFSAICAQLVPVSLPTFEGRVSWIDPQFVGGFTWLRPDAQSRIVRCHLTVANKRPAQNVGTAAYKVMAREMRLHLEAIHLEALRFQIHPRPNGFDISWETIGGNQW